MCRGQPKIIFAGQGTVLATVSFDHVQFLRPYTKTLWSEADMVLTDASARAMAKWFDRHGLHLYQREIDHNDEARAKEDAFRSSLPPGIRGCLHQPSAGSGSLDSTGLSDSPPECRGRAVCDRFASEVPDQIQRAHVIFRALGHLDGWWDAYDQDEAMVLDCARRIDPESLVAAIKGIVRDPIENGGAARVLFGSRREGAEWFKDLEPRIAEELAVRVAPGIFAAGDSHNARNLPWKLARFRSASANRVLLEAAEHAGQSDDRSCSRDGLDDANAPLSALVVLAERRRANPTVIKAAAARNWRCAVNRAAAHVAAALAGGVLPRAEDLKDADGTTAMMALRRFQERPTRQAVQIARETLLDHDWGVVREATKSWLAQ
jgi:hypothetical protein